MGRYLHRDDGVEIRTGCDRHGCRHPSRRVAHPAGFDHVALLLFLAGTYVLWGLGLRVNLQADWMLLEATGTSTMCPRRRHTSRQGQKQEPGPTQARGRDRLVGTELAKEAPSAVVAFGLAFLHRGCPRTKP